ncbi:MAG: DUF3566 domain-containing protein [Acidimicrobiia bacterium]|nr:DUF3566 domain-containing protein [Acidimicrobiia bacterium]
MVPPNTASDELVIDDDLVQALGFEPATDDFFDLDDDALAGDAISETVIDLDTGTAHAAPVADRTSTVAPLAPASPVGVPTGPPVLQPGTVQGEQVVIPRRLASDQSTVIDFRIENAGGRPRLKARKVRRVVRHVDPWSVLRFSILFHLVLFGALLLSSVLVWNAAELAGVVENLESLIAELGSLEEFVIDESAVFRAALVGAAMMTLASSVLLVLLSVVFNLISDLTGGIRFTVIEEERVRTVRRVQSKAMRAEKAAVVAQPEV